MGTQAWQWEQTGKETEGKSPVLAQPEKRSSEQTAPPGLCRWSSNCSAEEKVHLQILRFDPKKQFQAVPQLVGMFLFLATKEVAQIAEKDNIYHINDSYFLPSCSLKRHRDDLSPRGGLPLRIVLWEKELPQSG